MLYLKAVVSSKCHCFDSNTEDRLQHCSIIISNDYLKKFVMNMVLGMILHYTTINNFEQYSWWVCPQTPLDNSFDPRLNFLDRTLTLFDDWLISPPFQMVPKACFKTWRFWLGKLGVLLKKKTWAISYQHKHLSSSSCLTTPALLHGLHFGHCSSFSWEHSAWILIAKVTVFLQHLQHGLNL